VVSELSYHVFSCFIRKAVMSLWICHGRYLAIFKLRSTDNSVLADLTAQIIAAFSFLVRSFSAYLERDSVA